MKKIILVIFLMVQPLIVFAGQPLTRERVISFYATADAFDKLEAKYPREFQKMDSFSPVQTSEIIRYVKSSSAYSDILTVLKKNGFSNFEDFLDVSMRLMGSIFEVSMQKMSPQERQQMKAFEKTMEDNIKMMKQNGMPESMIAGMKAQIKDMQKTRAEMKQVAKSVTPADIKFVNENYDWLESIIPDDSAH